MNAVAPKSGVQAGGSRKSHRHSRKVRRTHRRKQSGHKQSGRKTAHRRR